MVGLRLIVSSGDTSKTTKTKVRPIGPILTDLEEGEFCPVRMGKNICYCVYPYRCTGR